MQTEPRLTVEVGDGSDVDEYRIRNRYVEFRPRRRKHSILPETASEWKRLAAEDVSFHLVLHTAVGEWLTVRLLKRSRRKAKGASLRD